MATTTLLINPNTLVNFTKSFETKVKAVEYKNQSNNYKVVSLYGIVDGEAYSIIDFLVNLDATDGISTLTMLCDLLSAMGKSLQERVFVDMLGRKTLIHIVNIIDEIAQGMVKPLDRDTFKKSNVEHLNLMYNLRINDITFEDFLQLYPDTKLSDFIAGKVNEQVEKNETALEQ